ncbi:replication initiation protein [Thiolapillus sp.]|uniref:replication initiation protein n=1 Tax=Thiolapillus sp. TaxID=2017437 RepID=UPI003AF7E2E7
MKIKKETVIMKNALARAQHDLNLGEKRIISIAISKINPKTNKINYNTTSARTITIETSDYQKTAKLSNEKNAYPEMKRSAKELINKKLKIKTRTMTGHQTEIINWISTLKYETGQGYLKISFTPEIMPYLVAIKDRFTRYELKKTEGIRSIYSWRMLEFLTSWSKDKTGKREISITEFGEMMGQPENYKTGDTIARIIKPAIKELEKKGWKITHERRKTNGKYTHITFLWCEP